MMNVKHNINDELLMGYAAGTLPEAFDLVIASHLSLSDDSRARLHGFEAIGGSMIEEEKPVEMSSGALSAVMERLDDAPVKPVDRRPLVEGVFPEPLQAYIGGDKDKVKWSSVGMGVKQCLIPTSGEANVRLLYIPAGTAVPDHGHRGIELTLVLQGAFRDEEDVFARGDIEIATEDLDHTPVAEPGEDCICLAATEAPLKFNSLMPRLLQPILKI